MFFELFYRIGIVLLNFCVGNFVCYWCLIDWDKLDREVSKW